MKFLCLAGTATNTEAIRMQLLPIVSDLENHGSMSFHYLAGSVEMPEFKGLEEYFGPAPHLRFLESIWPGVSDEQIYKAATSAPSGLVPEELFRYLERCLPPKSSQLVQKVLDDIYRTFEEEGPFDCIIGHSEGAAMAATFLIDYLKKREDAKSTGPLKCAVFMNGYAPHTVDGKGWVLADESGPLINIPTCHILGYNDALAGAAIALYHLCEEETATIVDHGRCHRIPRDPKSCKLITSGIRDLIARAEVPAARSG